MKLFPALNYVAAAASISVIILLIYATVQQSYRQGLNDPQIQMARDISYQLKQGKPINGYLKNDSLDIAQSLSPFIVLYNNEGRAIQSNALLHGQMPQIPAGLFEVVRKSGEHGVSWQPEKNIRIALVILKTNTSPNAFIAVGRSMIEVEERISRLITMIFIAWVLCMFILIITAAVNFIKRKRSAVNLR